MGIEFLCTHTADLNGAMSTCLTRKNQNSMRMLVFRSLSQGGVVRLSYRENREMHKVVCADCGQECEVPFKPDGTRPVYCRECYSKRKPPRRY